ncbi:hypothetical protein H072_6017 [Dactylellina haptotyla CBS 200.50]|uniref:Uncharacterized protein n=1 Tax=Dactylellina haptotyla (strain CBS 200.50) TaxID=1284197 RepID=S8BXY9_DACHA|nr:hypothetical protein H072_6017 [Dactylellina haptotyla CBS 200.50]
MEEEELASSSTEVDLDLESPKPPLAEPGGSFVALLQGIVICIRDLAFHLLEMLFLLFLFVIPPILTYFSFKPHYIKGLSKLISIKEVPSSPEIQEEISNLSSPEPPISTSDTETTISESTELAFDVGNLYALLSTNLIPVDNPKTGACDIVPRISNEALEIPASIINCIFECALESFEFENLVKETGCSVELYLLPDGSCEMILEGEDVGEDWVKVPERIIRFLADEVVRWVSHGGGEMILGEEWHGVCDNFIGIFSNI